MLSFELGNVSRLEKYNAGLLNNINAKSVVFACDENDPNAYFLVAEKDGKGQACKYIRRNLYPERYCAEGQPFFPVYLCLVVEILLVPNAGQ